MNTRHAFLLSSSHFLEEECYDGALTSETVINRAASALTRQERTLAATCLEDALRNGPVALGRLWKEANGQLLPAQADQAAFSRAAVAALRSPSLPFRREFRIEETVGS